MTEAGWDPRALVRDYGDPAGEADACRRAAALFDFSFVSRANVRGSGAERSIGSLTGRSLAGLAPGRIRYALRDTAGGHLLSDLTIWKHGPEHFEVMSGSPGDTAYLGSVAGRDSQVTDLGAATVILAVQGPGALAALEGLGAATVILAVQGPGALAALEGLVDLDAISALPYFGFCRARLGGEDCLVGRLGYTGEAGFEIVAARDAGPRLWSLLAGRARPAGFAAMDSLRIEAGFVLFANEFRLPVRAAEIGLARFAGDRPAPGADAIALVCFRAETDADPVLWRPVADPVRPDRSGMLVATSACASVVAGGVLGLGFVLASQTASPARFADPAGVFHDITLALLPYYDPEKKRPRAPWPGRGARTA